MPQKQHANATTTPEMRAFIRESDLPTAVLARLLKISEATVKKWRTRDDLQDASHTPKNLQTTLSPAQEYVVVELRKRLLLSLDELLLVSQQFINPDVSRSGLQRCLKRHGVSKLARLKDGESKDIDALPAMQPVTVPIEDKAAKAALHAEVNPDIMRAVLGEDEVVNVQLHKLPHLDGDDKNKKRRRLLIANEPNSNWLYVDLYEGDEKQAAERYMSHVLNNAPFTIRKILAGNYNEFLSRFRLIEESDD
ncbi:MAG: helix-turn-helix domain-containing protein [Pseudomonadales bacterium]|nr:helix-turn-helix domain-containing protein [Pseudomonadales bacterium]